MAEPIVAAIVNWIGSLLVHEATTLFKVVDQVKGLQQELELMQEFLQDADTKHEEGVRTLVRQVRKLAYEAEDVIDSYILEVPPPNEQRLKRYGHLLYNAYNIYKVGKQIEAIQSAVQRMNENINGCRLRRFVPELRNWRAQPKSYPFEDKNCGYVVGLEKNVLKLSEVLMGEGNTHINIISIVGMGGCGKTTLARMLYNHPYNKECFNCMAWVFISQEWKTQHILSEILRKVDGDRETSELRARLSAEELVDKLRKVLEHKSYLVVLDDVWRREAVEEVLPALPLDDMNRGSKIIITTRNKEIMNFPNLQQNLFVYEPLPLSEEESWQLFSKLALSHRTDCNLETFRSLGKAMLKNCGGLPLAIVALAGILKTKGSIGEWQQLSEVVRSRLMKVMCSNTHGSLQNLLALSYDDLPYDLKLCFLYLGVFPEDCQIPAGMLTRMWIAEGLITSDEGMSPEDVAMEHLEELSHRFMIQVVRTNFKGTIKAFHLHDLLRDLCLRKAKEQGFLQIYAADSNQATNNVSAATISSRRAALHSRSLILLTRSSILHSAYVSKEMLDLKVVHHNFKLLRLLNLWGIRTESGTLPKQIGSLIHLRYLGLRASNITALPKSIEKLRNLLTLDYRNIDSDKNVQVKIPNVLWKLVLLRHLFLPIECPWSAEEVLQLSALKNIRTLWGVKYNEGGDLVSRELKELSATVKKLKLFVSREEDLAAAFNCPSLSSDRLHTFYCEWSCGVSLRCVNTISHNQLLHKLVLVGKIEVNNLSVILPSNLVILELRDSVQDKDPMVTVGALAHLKFLRLSNSYLGTSFDCKITSFPVLEELYLESLPNLKTWSIRKGAMPCLKKLTVTKCAMLDDFPQRLSFVTNLQKLSLSDVPEMFFLKAKECGWSKFLMRLPQNFEAIIEQCDSFVDRSSLKKVYEQLTAGVFLNGERQKFWVVMQKEGYHNCFLLYATNLAPYDPFTEPDCPGLEESVNVPFAMTYHKDFCGSDVLCEPYEREHSFIISRCKYFKMQAEMEIVYLSPYVTYEFAFVIMIPRSVPDERVIQPAICQLFLCTPSAEFFFPRPVARPQRHGLRNKPRDEWFRLSIGEFNAYSSNIVTKLYFRLEVKIESLVIQGVIIEPKR